MTYTFTGTSNKKSSRMRGQVLVELLIVAPVLLMIPAGVLEYTRFLRYDQLAVAFSQEAANQAYRQCADWNAVTQGRTTVTFDKVKSTELTGQCIEQVVNQTRALMDQRIPGGRSRVIVAVYRYNYGWSASDPDPEPLETTLVAIRPAQGLADAFSKTVVSEPVGVAELVRTTDNAVLVSAAQAAVRQRMVVAEVTFGYEPVFALFNAFMGADSVRTEGGFRETTIL